VEDVEGREWLKIRGAGATAMTTAEYGSAREVREIDLGFFRLIWLIRELLLRSWHRANRFMRGSFFSGDYYCPRIIHHWRDLGRRI
jgi:hypothetical protein